MCKVLFVLPAETIYEEQNRVMGWKSTTVPKRKLKTLKALVPRLKELGAERVIASDLDNQSGWTVARDMGLRCEEWQSIRRFNFGKHHGESREKAEELLHKMEEKWKMNPDIPVHNGDSFTSFSSRLAATRERLKKQKGVAVVIMRQKEIERLTGIKANLEHGRVYEWVA